MSRSVGLLLNPRITVCRSKPEKSKAISENSVHSATYLISSFSEGMSRYFIFQFAERTQKS